MTVPKYYYNLNRCITDGEIQFDTTNMPKETYEVNGQVYCGSNDLMDLLNEQHQEIQHIKTTLNNMIETERTELGKSVLKQFREAIQ